MWERLRRIDPFWPAYVALLALYLRHPLSASWDPAEYLAYGKYIFGGYGFDAYYRPIVWPFFLGMLWKVGLPMPASMYASTAITYALIPLSTYFLARGPRKYLGLLIASNPVFFRWSHLPLSHLPATLFLLLAVSTAGHASGAFSALSGLSRFTFLTALINTLGSRKKLVGAGAVLAVYGLAIFAAYGDPLAQVAKASETIGWSRYYRQLWTQDPLFYLKVMWESSPLLLLGFLELSRFTVAALFSYAFFAFRVFRKEDRFFIDILPYLGINISRRKWLTLLIVAFQLTQLTGVKEFREEVGYAGLIEDGTTVIGNHPGINAYRDVRFRPWFDYFQPFNFTGVDYCIYYVWGIPCIDGACEDRVREFYAGCTDGRILYNQSGIIVSFLSGAGN